MSLICTYGDRQSQKYIIVYTVQYEDETNKMNNLTSIKAKTLPNTRIWHCSTVHYRVPKEDIQCKTKWYQIWQRKDKL